MKKSVVLYCRKGIRSQIAIQWLQVKYGFDNLINRKGGIEAWKKERGQSAISGLPGCQWGKANPGNKEPVG